MEKEDGGEREERGGRAVEREGDGAAETGDTRQDKEGRGEDEEHGEDGMVDEQEEQGAGTEGESGTQEKRGRASKKSKASDSELIGIVSLYRLRFGNERQTPETAREQVRESGCGTPWKRDETSELQRLLADLGNIGEEDRGQ